MQIFFILTFGLVPSGYVSNLSKIGPVVAEIFLFLIFEVFFLWWSSSMQVLFILTFGLVPSAYVSNLSKSRPVVAEIFLFFQRRSFFMKGCLHF